MDGSVPLSKRQASPHWAPGAGLVLVEVSHDVVSFASAEACQVEYAGASGWVSEDAMTGRC